MKGGKAGRKRRGPGGGAKRTGGPRPGAKPRGAKATGGAAPGKGGKVKPQFGGRSSAEED